MYHTLDIDVPSSAAGPQVPPKVSGDQRANVSLHGQIRHHDAIQLLKRTCTQVERYCGDLALQSLSSHVL